jgi:hypothetical protein
MFYSKRARPKKIHGEKANRQGMKFAEILSGTSLAWTSAILTVTQLGARCVSQHIA